MKRQPQDRPRRWPLVVALVLLGAISGALLAPRIFNPEATPERLRSKKGAEKRTPEARWDSEGAYESKNVRIKFRTDGFKPKGAGDVYLDPTDDGGLRY